MGEYVKAEPLHQRSLKIMEDFAEAHDLPDSVLLYYH